MTRSTGNDSLVTVDAKIKVKGFKPDNLGILSLTKEDLQIKQRVGRLLNTEYYTGLSGTHKEIISKFLSGYESRASGKPLEHDEYVLAGHELVEIEGIHDWEI